MKVKLTGIKNESDEKTMNLIDIQRFSDENQQSIIDQNREQIEVLIHQMENDDNFDENYLQLQMVKKRLYNTNTHLSDVFDTNILPTGFVNGEVYVLSGISGGGKTALSIFLTSIAISGNNHYCYERTFPARKVIYISLEQDKRKIKARIASTLGALDNMNTTISYSNLITGNFSTTDFKNFSGLKLLKIYEKNLRIMDSTDFKGRPTLSVLFEKLTTELTNVFKNALVVLDQFDNLEGADDLQSNQLADEIKAFAVLNNIPIIVQTQINKNGVVSAHKNDGSYDTNKILGASLKGNSSLEHQASAVIFILPTGEQGTISGHNATKMNLFAPKNRYGENKKIEMWFVGGVNLFIDRNKKVGRPNENKV